MSKILILEDLRTGISTDELSVLPPCQYQDYKEASNESSLKAKTGKEESLHE